MQMYERNMWVRMHLAPCTLLSWALKQASVEVLEEGFGLPGPAARPGCELAIWQRLHAGALMYHDV